MSIHTRAYVLVPKFSTHVSCDITVIGTETSVLSVRLMEDRKTRFNGQYRSVVDVVVSPDMLSVRHSRPMNPDSD